MQEALGVALGAEEWLSEGEGVVSNGLLGGHCFQQG